MFSGSMVALVTPMLENGAIDFNALQELLEWHIDAKTSAIVAAGTTGESATLDPEEQFELISFIVKKVAKRIPVIAGAGTNSTKTTLALSNNAKRAGADACLLVTPYYNKPTQLGLYEHYKTIAETVSLPVILYNVPGRTACDLLPETVEALSKVKNIIGIKEATGQLARAVDIMKRCPKSFELYSGDDPTAIELMQHGARGVISVTANIHPEKMARMCDDMAGGNITSAKKINEELNLLHHKLFLEANPIPSKWALQQMNKIASGIRLPLLPLDPKFHQEVKEAMLHAGVLI